VPTGRQQRHTTHVARLRLVRGFARIRRRDGEWIETREDGSDCHSLLRRCCAGENLTLSVDLSEVDFARQFSQRRGAADQMTGSRNAG
jgi:hypothetical protein